MTPRVPSSTGDSAAPTNVLIVDTDPWAAQGVVAALLKFETVRLLGIVHSGEAALAVARAQCAQVTFLDLDHSEGITGSETTAELLKLNSASCVIGMSVSVSRAKRQLLLDAGARAVLRKDGDLAQLATAMRWATTGGSPASLHSVADPPLESAIVRDARHPLAPKLSRAEAEALLLVCAGKSYQEMSVELCISRHSVDSRLRGLRAKLGAKSLVEVVIRAIKYRLVTV